MNSIKAMKEFLLHKELPADEKFRQLIKHFADECFVENNIVWRRIKKRGEVDRVVILLPRNQVQHVLKDVMVNVLTDMMDCSRLKNALVNVMGARINKTITSGHSPDDGKG
jgi:hypothetical protein